MLSTLFSCISYICISCSLRIADGDYELVAESESEQREDDANLIGVAEDPN